MKDETSNSKHTELNLTFFEHEHLQKNSKIGDSPKSNEVQMEVWADNLKESSQNQKHMDVQLENKFEYAWRFDNNRPAGCGHQE